MMYFYKVDAGGYEEYMESTYYSDKQYSQEEFHKIVLEAYEKVCYINIENDVQSTCFPNIFFTVEDIMFSEWFDEVLERDYGLKRLSQCLSGRVFFDLRETDDEVEDILLNLDIDKSCYDNDCCKLDDKIEDKNKFRENCLISMLMGNDIGEL